MRFILSLLAVLVLGALAMHLVAAALFTREAGALADQVAAGPPAVARDLPDAVRRLARAQGVTDEAPARAVRVTQDAELQLSAGAPFEPAPATQTYGLGAPNFVWFAETPLLPGLPKFRVIDAYVGGEGRLAARALGSIPVASASGAEINRAEAMRYLAELAWIPDAILGNPAIEWAEREDGWLEATLRLEPRDATVRFRLEDGVIAEMRADARPAETAPDGSQLLLDWRGLFTDYAEIGGRRIPTRGEVGYIRDGDYAPYWRGTITSYEILR